MGRPGLAGDKGIRGPQGNPGLDGLPGLPEKDGSKGKVLVDFEIVSFKVELGLEDMNIISSPEPKAHR